MLFNGLLEVWFFVCLFVFLFFLFNWCYHWTSVSVWRVTNVRRLTVYLYWVSRCPPVAVNSTPVLVARVVLAVQWSWHIPQHQNIVDNAVTVPRDYSRRIARCLTATVDVIAFSDEGWAVGQHGVTWMFWNKNYWSKSKQVNKQTNNSNKQSNKQKQKEIQTSKRSKRTLLGQNATCEFWGSAHWSSYKMTLIQQLNSEKRWKMRWRTKPPYLFLSCPVLGRISAWYSWIQIYLFFKQSIQYS